MNEKYGIQPECIDSALSMKYVMDLFGLHQGRFLAEFPRSWKRRFFEYVSGLPDVEQARIKRVLERGCDSGVFLRVGAAYCPELSWVENALGLKSKGLVHEVFSRDGTSGAHFDEIDERLVDGRGVRVAASAKALVAVAEPLLQLNTEIVLVDPYICLARQNYLSFIRELLSNPCSKGKQFVFYSLDRHFAFKGDMEYQARKELEGFLQPGTTVKFCSVRDDDMHGRYMFTIRGGLKYDKGFQADDRAVVDIETLSPSVNDAYFEKYVTARNKLSIDRVVNL